jgi:hypothetical protein
VLSNVELNCFSMTSFSTFPFTFRLHSTFSILHFVTTFLLFLLFLKFSERITNRLTIVSSEFYFNVDLFSCFSCCLQYTVIISTLFCVLKLNLCYVLRLLEKHSSGCLLQRHINPLGLTTSQEYTLENTHQLQENCK